MSDIGFWLTKKYAIAGQNADTEGRLRNAEASKTNAEAGEVAANSAATRAAAYGQADASFGSGAAQRAHANLLNTNATLAPALAGSEINQRNASADLSGAQTRATDFGIRRNPGLALTLGQLLGLHNEDGSSASTAIPGSVLGKGSAGPNSMDLNAPVSNPGQTGFSTDFHAGTSSVPHPAEIIGHALGYRNPPMAQPAPQQGAPMSAPKPSPMPVEHHASGTSMVGAGVISMPQAAPQDGTRAVGNNIAGTPAGPSFTGANPVHGSDPRDIPAYHGGTADAGFGNGMPEPQNYKKGTQKVAGKGDGKTDTTPAMLAPGEAVLNKAAAEHLGRDTIDLLNAAGAQKMGINQDTSTPDGAAQPQGALHAKAGASDVPAPKGAQKAPAKAGKPGDKVPPAKGKEPPAARGAKAAPKSGDKPAAPKKGGSGISPQMIAALAGMMGSGGGMPAPGGAPAAPMAPMTPPPAAGMPGPGMPPLR